MRLSALLYAGVTAAFAVADLPRYVKRQTSSPTVNLDYEIHQGTLNATANFYTFTNVPYAEQPIDDLRFQKPILPIVGGGNNGSAINDGGATPINCPQAYPQWVLNRNSAAGAQTKRQIAGGQTESCLVLDVYVPTDVFTAGATAEAPVLVWIHGGGFTLGSKTASGSLGGLLSRSQIDGGERVIIVSINYRLGMFGWLYGNDITTNLGLYDQRVSFEWVRKYISRFGGSPDKITVMGESAGASSLVHQVTAFGGETENLFRGAIPLSPAFDFDIDVEAGYRTTLATASALTGTTVNSVAALNEFDTSTLQSINQAAVFQAPYGGFLFGPAADGTFVPKVPQVLLLEGRFDQSIEFLISRTSNESVTFTSTNITTPADFLDYIEASLHGPSDETLSTIANDIYPDVLDGTYPWVNEFTRAVQVSTDASFICTTGFLATAKDNQTFNYIFAYPPGYHAGDLRYVFFNGDTTTLNNGFPVNSEIAYQLQDVIIEFVRKLDPNKEGLPAFARYGADGKVLIFGLNGFEEGIDDVRNERCAWIQQALVDELF